MIESQFGSRPFIGRLTALENLDPAPATQPCRNLTARDPQGPAEGELRIVRGGYMSIFSRFARASFREKFVPELRAEIIGFRSAGESI